jgi:hypothetical protein
MRKISINQIGFIILSSFILISPVMANSAYSLNNFPGLSLPSQTLTRDSLIGSNLLDRNGLGLEIGDLEIGDDGNIELGSDFTKKDNLIEDFLEVGGAIGTIDPRDITRDSLKELVAGSINNKFLANQLAGNLEAAVEEGAIGELATTRSFQQAEQQQLELAVDASQAADIIKDLNGLFSSCNSLNYDMAVHTIKGKTNLNKILNNNDDISIEIIIDNKPTDTSLVLVDSPTVFLKGIIKTDPYDSDPNQYKFDISHINTDCIAKTLTDKPMTVQADLNDPLVIPNEARLTSVNARFFQPCGTLGDAALNNIALDKSDFAKYKLIGTSKEIQHKDLSINGNVDLSVKIFVDLTRGTILPSTDPATVVDDNRIVAMQLIANEGKNGEEKFDFIPKDALSECSTVTFLQEPQNIANNEEFGNPLYGFEKRQG